MKSILSLQLTMLLSLGFAIPAQSAEADGEKEIRKEKEVKESRPDREKPNQEKPTGDGEKRPDREDPREERDLPRKEREETRKDKPRREGEVRREHGERERDVVGARRLNAVFCRMHSPSLIVVGVGDSGKEMRVRVQAETKIYINGKAASLNDLKPDMQLSVQQEGELTTRIEARPSRARGPRDVERKGEPSARDKGVAKPEQDKDAK